MADKRLNSEKNSDSSDGTDNELSHKKRTTLAGAAIRTRRNFIKTGLKNILL